MTFNQPIQTLVAGLLFMLLFVLSSILVQGPWAGGQDGLVAQSASGDNVPQDQDEDEDEDEEEEEEWDEEEWDEEERDEEEDWDEEEREEWEEEAEQFAREHEFEMRELEGSLGRLEMAQRLADVADHKTATASYAIMQMHEVFDDEEETIEFLNVMVRSDKVSAGVNNLLKMKLVEVLVGAERHEEARETLKSMIVD
ncbi:MAG: hypothetical protein MK106_14935 [Mariniblastus sp.]|nr:hypothetical protein [Mariniblastus sp.]